MSATNEQNNLGTQRAEKNESAMTEYSSSGMFIQYASNHGQRHDEQHSKLNGSMRKKRRTRNKIKSKGTTRVFTRTEMMPISSGDLPTCQCTKTSGAFALNSICPHCGTHVMNMMERNMDLMAGSVTHAFAIPSALLLRSSFSNSITINRGISDLTVFLEETLKSRQAAKAYLLNAQALPKAAAIAHLGRAQGKSIPFSLYYPMVLLSGNDMKSHEADTFIDLPGVGEPDTLYFTLDTEKIYGWKDASYHEVNPDQFLADPAVNFDPDLVTSELEGRKMTLQHLQSTGVLLEGFKLSDTLGNVGGSIIAAELATKTIGSREELLNKMRAEGLLPERPAGRQSMGIAHHSPAPVVHSTRTGPDHIGQVTLTEEDVGIEKKQLPQIVMKDEYKYDASASSLTDKHYFALNSTILSEKDAAKLEDLEKRQAADPAFIEAQFIQEKCLLGGVKEEPKSIGRKLWNMLTGKS